MVICEQAIPDQGLKSSRSQCQGSTTHKKPEYTTYHPMSIQLTCYKRGVFGKHTALHVSISLINQNLICWQPSFITPVDYIECSNILHGNNLVWTRHTSDWYSETSHAIWVRWCVIKKVTESAHPIQRTHLLQQEIKCRQPRLTQVPTVF